jgi:tRNA(fMet)-specific endonuclease VapC
VDELLEIVTVLPFDTRAARRHGELKDILRRAGTPLADLDLQIASIALSHGLPLVTHNTAHFNRIPGLVLVDWLA